MRRSGMALPGWAGAYISGEIGSLESAYQSCGDESSRARASLLGYIGGVAPRSILPLRPAPVLAGSILQLLSLRSAAALQWWWWMERESDCCLAPAPAVLP